MSTDVISFIVPAIPIAQPRPRATMARGGKGARIHEVTHIKNANTGERKPHPIAAFKATIRMAAQQAYQGPPLTGPIQLDWCAVFPRPGRLVWKTRAMPRERHITKPDRDNVEKAIMDALKGLVWVDDCQVCDGTPQKWIAAGDEQPHVSITVRRLG